MRKHNQIHTLGAPLYKAHFRFLRKLKDFKCTLWSEKYGIYFAYHVGIITCTNCMIKLRSNKSSKKYFYKQEGFACKTLYISFTQKPNQYSLHIIYTELLHSIQAIVHQISFHFLVDNIYYRRPSLWSNVYQHGLCLGLLCRSLVQVRSVLLKKSNWMIPQFFHTRWRKY